MTSSWAASFPTAADADAFAAAAAAMGLERPTVVERPDGRGFEARWQAEGKLAESIAVQALKASRVPR